MSNFLDFRFPHTEQTCSAPPCTIALRWAEQMKLGVSSAFQNGILSLLLMMYFSAAVNSPASFGSIVTRSSIWVKELTSTSSWEHGPSVDEEAQHEVVGSISSIASSFTSTCWSWSAISTMLRSGSDLIITGSSALGAAIAKDTVGDDDEEEEEEEEEEGSEKTVVGRPGWPSGVRMIVFVPENGGRAMAPPAEGAPPT